MTIVMISRMKVKFVDLLLFTSTRWWCPFNESSMMRNIIFQIQRASTLNFPCCDEDNYAVWHTRLHAAQSDVNCTGGAVMRMTKTYRLLGYERVYLPLFKSGRYTLSYPSKGLYLTDDRYYAPIAK